VTVPEDLLIVNVPTFVPLLKSFIAAPTQSSPVVRGKSEQVAVINQPHLLPQFCGNGASSLNAWEWRSIKPYAVPRLQGVGDDCGGLVDDVDGGIVGGQVVMVLVSLGGQLVWGGQDSLGGQLVWGGQDSLGGQLVWGGQDSLGGQLVWGGQIGQQH